MYTTNDGFAGAFKKSQRSLVPISPRSPSLDFDYFGFFAFGVSSVNFATSLPPRHPIFRSRGSCGSRLISSPSFRIQNSARTESNVDIQHYPAESEPSLNRVLSSFAEFQPSSAESHPSPTEFDSPHSIPHFFAPIFLTISRLAPAVLPLPKRPKRLDFPPFPALSRHFFLNRFCPQDCLFASKPVFATVAGL